MKIPAILKKRWVVVAMLVVTILAVCGFFTVNYNEPTQIGIARNLITGEMVMQEGGIYFKPPWVWVVRIDTRPVRLGIMSGGRGYDAKLVQFDKRYWKEFVAIEGWRYYWFSNRISLNFGHESTYRGMDDVMIGYAYSSKKYPFVVILEEYHSK